MTHGIDDIKIQLVESREPMRSKIKVGLVDLWHKAKDYWSDNKQDIIGYGIVFGGSFLVGYGIGDLICKDAEIKRLKSVDAAYSTGFNDGAKMVTDILSANK